MVASMCLGLNVFTYEHITTGTVVSVNDTDFETWKHFLHQWPFVRGIHQSPVDCPYKRPMKLSFNVFFFFLGSLKIKKIILSVTL